MKLAKIRHRVMATILDNLIIFWVMFLLLIGVWPQLLYAIIKDFSINAYMIIKVLRVGIVYALFLLFYYILIPMFFKGQTIGKKVFKIKVVDEEDKDVDYKVLFFREAICRILVRTVSLGISSFVSFIIMVVREDRKSLADVFSKTKVIDIKEDI